MRGNLKRGIIIPSSTLPQISAVFDKGYQVDKKIHKKSIPVDNSTFPFNKMTT